MTTENDGSVTQWIGSIKQGDHAAAQPLWERYFEKLVRLARGKLAGGKGLAAYEEDVALSAFDSFCRAATAGRFPLLDDRDDLWRLLVSLTVRKAVNLRKHSARAKRGGGNVLDEAALARPGASNDDGLNAVVGNDPTPALAAAVADECRALLGVLDRKDPTTMLRRVALLKMECYTKEEIAERLECSPRMVGYRLEYIRKAWEA